MSLEDASKLPEQSAPARDLSATIWDLKNLSSALFFAIMGLESHCRENCPNPEDFHGVEHLARDVHSLAAEVDDAFPDALRRSTGGAA